MSEVCKNYIVVCKNYTVCKKYIVEGRSVEGRVKSATLSNAHPSCANDSATTMGVSGK